MAATDGTSTTAEAARWRPAERISTRRATRVCQRDLKSQRRSLRPGRLGAQSLLMKKERAFWKKARLIDMGLQVCPRGPGAQSGDGRRLLARSAQAGLTVAPRQQSIQKKARRRRRGSVARTRRASVARSRRSSVSTTKSLLEKFVRRLGRSARPGTRTPSSDLGRWQQPDLWNNTEDLDPDTQAQLKKLDWRTRLPPRPEGHTAAITRLAFSPDGEPCSPRRATRPCGAGRWQRASASRSFRATRRG